MGDKPRGPKGPLPARWLKCPRKGGIIAGKLERGVTIGKFIPFKTPLDHNFNTLIEPQFRFTPSQLINSVHSQIDPATGQKRKIGLWIDLTNTDRFYDKSEVEEKGIKYVKLKCLGREETPTIEQVSKFIHVCRSFVDQKPNELIATHCTHGFNRTGFMISSYLVEVDDWSVQMSIQAFETQRPPGIYKSDYLQELIKRFDDGEPVPQAPPLPDWCFEEEEDDEQVNGHRGNDQHAQGDHHDNIIGNVAFMEGVDGVIPVTNNQQRKNLIDVVRSMTEWKGKDPFPGAQPVSMTLKNIELLKQFPYKVSWKADGTRYMMLIKDRDEIYFFDRNSHFFQVQNISFPRRGAPNDVVTNTLLDGEMVIDKDDRGNKTARYLIYDIVTYPGTQIGQCDFNKRMQCIKSEIIGPRHEALKNGRINRNQESFGIRVKDFWEIVGAEKLLSPDFTKNVGHETDGLIFQPVPLRYESGTNETILKWKPHTLNSIDFKVKIVTKSEIGCIREKVVQYWTVGGPIGKPFFEIAMSSIKNQETKAELRNYDNQLVECVWEGGKPPVGWFKVIRTRTDKPNPNSWSTAVKVMESIVEPVTQERLLHYVKRVTEKKDSGHSSAASETKDKSMMPPPTKKLRSE